MWPVGKAFFLSAAVGISCSPPLENQPSVTSVMEPCVMCSSAVHNQIKAKIFMGVQRDWERFCQLELRWARTDYAIIVLYEHVHAVLLQFWHDYMCVSSSPYWMLIGLECPSSHTHTHTASPGCQHAWAVDGPWLVPWTHWPLSHVAPGSLPTSPAPSQSCMTVWTCVWGQVRKVVFVCCFFFFLHSLIKDMCASTCLTGRSGEQAGI